MDKIHYDFEILTGLTNLLMQQKVEPTKYFFTSMFFRLNRLKQYNAQDIKQWWQKAAKEIRDGKKNKLLNFYIHIPFCESKCSYCMYPSIVPSDKEIVQKYLKRVCDETTFYKDTFSGVEFKNIYIGGGSASTLSEKNITRLLTSLADNFSFSAKGQRNFECNPSSTTLSKLQIIKKFGFNRVSFGVQSLDRRVLKYANRGYQTYGLVKKAILDAQRCGFEINVDLMIGLYGDSAESCTKSFTKIAKLHPTAISLYHLHPSAHYVEKYFNNKESSFYSGLKKKIAGTLTLLKPIAEKFNYTCPQASYLNEGYSVTFNFRKQRKNKENSDRKRVNSYYSNLPCSIFGIGYSSVAKIVGMLRYNNILPLEEDFNPLGNCYQGSFCQLEDDMRDYILIGFVKQHSVSQSEFRRIFNKNLLDTFQYAFRALNKLGKIKITDDLIYFLPRKPKEVFICGLFFWDKKELLQKLMSNKIIL